jgi:type I restriction enzyme, S subunit
MRSKKLGGGEVSPLASASSPAGSSATPLGGGGPRKGVNSLSSSFNSIAYSRVSLGDFVSLQRGHDLTESERCHGTIPVMGSAGHNGFHNVALAKGPGIVIGRSGSSFGQVHYSPIDFWPHNTALYVTDFKDNDERFAFYLLNSIDFSGYNSGSAQPSLNRNLISMIEIVAPPLHIQKAIAHILGTLDDRIELCRRMNETLEAMARALFKDWFIDFGPVRAKAEGREPPGLSPEIAALFPDKLVESELGEIPEGWGVGTLLDVGFLNPESWSKKNAPQFVDYLDLSNVKWGMIEAVTRYPWAESPSRAQRIVRPGDTIVGTVRPGNGSFCLVDCDGLTASTGFAVLRPKFRFVQEFLYLAATTNENIERLSHLADGGAYPAVRPEVVAASAIVTPPQFIFEAFSTAVSKHFAQTDMNRATERTLSTLRDALLPKLLSGELTVSDFEAEQVGLP